MNDSALTDPLVQAFEQAQLDPSRFHHREHLAVAWCYLQALPLEDALARYVRHLRRLVTALGAEQKFHRTLTWGWMLLLDEAMERVVNLTGLGVERAVGSPLFALERALEQSGLGFTHVRPNYIMQNLCSGPARRDLVERDELAVAGGDARISWVAVRDVAEVCAAALVRDDLAGRALDLTGPAALSYAAFAEALTRATGRTIRYVALEPDEARARLLAEGVPADRVAGSLAMLALARGGAFSQVSRHVAEVLGRAATSADDFTRTHAHHWARET